MRTPILAKDCTASCSLSSSSTKDIVLPLVLMLGKRVPDCLICSSLTHLFHFPGILVIFLIGLDACKARGLRPDITSVQCVERLYGACSTVISLTTVVLYDHWDKQ